MGCYKYGMDLKMCKTHTQSMSVRLIDYEESRDATYGDAKTGGWVKGLITASASVDLQVVAALSLSTFSQEVHQEVQFWWSEPLSAPTGRLSSFSPDVLTIESGA